MNKMIQFRKPISIIVYCSLLIVISILVCICAMYVTMERVQDMMLAISAGILASAFVTLCVEVVNRIKRKELARIQLSDVCNMVDVFCIDRMPKDSISEIRKSIYDDSFEPETYSIGEILIISNKIVRKNFRKIKNPVVEVLNNRKEHLTLEQYEIVKALYEVINSIEVLVAYDAVGENKQSSNSLFEYLNSRNTKPRRDALIYVQENIEDLIGENGRILSKDVNWEITQKTVWIMDLLRQLNKDLEEENLLKKCHNNDGELIRLFDSFDHVRPIWNSQYNYENRSKTL